MSEEKQQSFGQTKKCPKCQEEISKNAKKCKHCGSDLRNWFLRHKIISVVLIFFVLVIIGGSSGENNKQTNTNVQNNLKQEQEEVTVEVTAIKLSEEYDANKVAADAKYKDKRLKVTGIIDGIGKDILDDPYVTLEGMPNRLFGVQCMFSKSKEQELINLKKGQEITLTGKMSGEMIGNVVLRECDFFIEK